MKTHMITIPGRSGRLIKQMRLAAALALGLVAGALPATAETPAAVSGGTLVFAEPSLFTTAKLNSFTTSIYLLQTTDRLLFINAENQVEPNLAKDWSLSEDRLHYTLTLRENVTFSDGTPLTAEIVKRNFDRYGLGDKAKGVPAHSRFTKYEGTEVIDAHTVRISLKEPDFYFSRAVLAYSSIYAASTLDQPDYDSQSAIENIVGTGPFVLETQSPEQEIVLVRREDYAWAPPSYSNQGAAWLDRLVIRPIPEAGLRAGAVVSGQVHLARALAPVDERAVLDAGFAIHSVQQSEFTSNYAIIRAADHEQLSDRRVRLALQLGFDRNALIDTVLSPSYKPALGLWGRGAPGFADLSADFATYDPARANALLDEASWTGRDAEGFRTRDGKRLTVSVAASGSSSSAIRPAFEFIEEDWRALGVELLNYAGDDTVWNTAQKDPSYSLLAVRNPPGQALPSILARSRLDDPKLRDLTESALAAETDEQFDQRLREYGRYIVEQGYAIVLFDEVQVHAAAPGLTVDYNISSHPIFQSARLAR